MNEIGHLLLLDAAIDQFARLILGHGGPFLERHGTTELGPRWVLRCERHDGLDLSTLHTQRICKRSDWFRCCNPRSLLVTMLSSEAPPGRHLASESGSRRGECTKFYPQMDRENADETVSICRDVDEGGR